MYNRLVRSRLRRLAETISYIRFYRDPVGAMVRLHREHGELVPVRLGPKPILFGFGPQYNRLAMHDPSTFHSRSVLLPGPPDSAQHRLNAGLLTMNGTRHREDRRLVAPPFARKNLGAYHAAMVRIIDDALQKWRPGETRDMAWEFTALATRISSYVLFGIEDEHEAYAMGADLRQWLHQNFRLAVRLFRHDLPGAPFRSLLRSAEQAERRVRSMIVGRRCISETPNDVLSILIHAADHQDSRINEDQLIGHAAILFGASHETTIAALSWTLLLLAQHPTVSHELINELTGTLRGNPPDMDQVEKLPMLEGVIKESMRLVPPVAFSSRRAACDVEIDNIRWPAGTTLVFSHYVTHHMPEIYAQPEQFVPARWLTIDPSPYEYLPFSAGPRTCLGMDFSLLEQKLILAMLFQRYRLSTLPGAIVNRVSRLVTMPSAVMMKVHRQDHAFAATPIGGNIREMINLN